jgi:hypothetical protein
MSNLTFINIQPQYTRIVYDYQDLNKDPKIHQQIVKFFQKKIIKWMNNNILKKNINFIKSKEGFEHIYHLIKKFVKKENVKWYELREKNYNLVKEYIILNI